MAQFDGVHAIPILNSSAKCLIENWVEERAAEHLDAEYPKLDKQKRGHRGVLTLAEKEKMKEQPTTRSAFVVPDSNLPPSMGPRQKLKEKFYLQAALSASAAADSIEKTSPLTSEYRDRIAIPGFESRKPEARFPHRVYGEIPVSYWTEKVGTTGIHGISQIKTRDSPFRKNTAFSKPIGEAMDDTSPYEFEKYPDM